MFPTIPAIPNDGPPELCDVPVVHQKIVNQVRASLPGEEEFAALAELFKVFGDLTRIRILSVLAAREICVCDLAAVLGMTQSAVSHQLRSLKNARLIRSRREGKTVFYSLADAHVVSILACATDHVRE